MASMLVSKAAVVSRNTGFGVPPTRASAARCSELIDAIISPAPTRFIRPTMDFALAWLRVAYDYEAWSSLAPDYDCIALQLRMVVKSVSPSAQANLPLPARE